MTTANPATRVPMVLGAVLGFVMVTVALLVALWWWSSDSCIDQGGTVIGLNCQLANGTSPLRALLPAWIAWSALLVFASVSFGTAGVIVGRSTGR